MILQDLRRHLFRTLYYVYAVYAKESAVSEVTSERVTAFSGYAYWAAYDYKVENGRFILVDPFLTNTDFDVTVGMWTMDLNGNAVNEGTTIYRIESVSPFQTFTKYDNTVLGYKPGIYIHQERTLEANFPANGPSGSYWYELLGTTESQETQWYWEYTTAGIFVPHTSGIYRVTCIGGGGGGGAGGKGAGSVTTGDASDTWGGGGGGSGYPGTTTVKDVILTEGTSYPVTIGSGGNGGNAGDMGNVATPGNGYSGGASSLGNLVQGAGGTYGRKGGDATTRAAGSGGGGGNPGGAGALNTRGTGGREKGTTNGTYNWRFKNGTGGAGGRGAVSANANMYGDRGSAGTAGIVIVEFRGL